MTEALENYKRRLNSARKGGGILFCGSGFSADCLGFDADETLGTGGQLLGLFNNELKQRKQRGGYRSLQNAADALKEQIGELGQMQLLKKRYDVSDVSQDLVDILRFPWQRIYTTNYDNAIEVAGHRAPKKLTPLNNTQDPSDECYGVPVIHLHGYSKSWDIHNFSESCILGGESYLRLPNVKPWLDMFKLDVERAQFIAFVGFSAADFHINQVIFDLTGLKEKAFFINRPTHEPDIDIDADQRRLGTPMYCGRSGFANEITHLLEQAEPEEPRLVSFRKFEPASPAPGVPAVSSIENFFLFGETDAQQISRDATNRDSQFHLYRDAVDTAVHQIDQGTRVLLLNGYPCDGKSILINDISIRLSATRQVFHLRQTYDSLVDETSRILAYDPKAALVIENCFDIRNERLMAISKMIDGTEALLLLSSRAISSEAEAGARKGLLELKTYHELQVTHLNEREAADLASLVNQFAGWRHFYSGKTRDQVRFIMDTCKASLPHFLLKLLESQHVRNRYREELNKIPMGDKERQTVIASLYVAHMGHDAPISFLSNNLSDDAGNTLDRLQKSSQNSGFHLVRRQGEFVRTVPSIGASNILKELFDDQEIVQVVVTLVKALSDNRYLNDFEDHMLRQMMRYSILRNVVSSPELTERFFDHLSQSRRLVQMPLFWLQWHMAKADNGDFADAEKFLEQGYRAAEEYERRQGISYNKRQLDDRKAKFLMARLAKGLSGTGSIFRDFRSAYELTARILNENMPQHYPYETLALIVETYSKRASDIAPAHQEQIRKWIDTLIKKAEQRLPVLAEGYQLAKANNALEKTKSFSI